MAKVVLNENKELVAFIKDALKFNKDTFGREYCPCKAEHTDDNVCMCKEFREQESGECHCGLYVKI